MAEDTTPDVTNETPAAAAPATPETPVPQEQPVSGDIGGDPKKMLYLKMKSGGLYTKGFNDFKQQFSTPDKVNKLHDFLSNKGKYTKGADAFSAQFFPDVKAPAPTPLKKKDLSQPGSGGGSPQPPTTGASDQTSQTPESNDLLNKAAIAGQANNEVIAQQQQQLPKAVHQLNFLMGDDHPAPPDPSLPDYSMVTDPALRDQLKAKDTASINTMQQQLANAQKAYRDANPGVKTPEPTSDGTISKYVAPTAWQQINLGAKYLVSKAAYGLDAMTTGLEHDKDLVNKSLMSPDDYTQNQKDQAQYTADENKKLEDVRAQNGGDYTIKPDLKNPYDLNPEFIQKGYPDNPVMNAAGQVSAMIPIIGASAINPTIGASSMYLQNVGSAVQQVDAMKKAGVKFDNHTDELYIQGMGFIGYMLGKSVTGRLMGDAGDAILNKMAAEATRDLAAKGADVTADDIANAYLGKALPFMDKVQQLGVNALKTYVMVGTDLMGANVVETALKQGVNAANKKAPFDVKPAEYVTDVTSPFYSGDYKENGNPLNMLKNLITAPAAGFSLMGAAIQGGGLFDNSPYRNVVIDNLQKDASPQNVAEIKKNLQNYGEYNGWTHDDIANSMTTVDMLAEVAGKVPGTLPKEQYRNAVNLIAKRRTLEGVLQETQARKGDLDPAIQNQVQPFEKLVKARIDQANDQLTEIVSGKRFQYFEHEGFYFKQQLGEDYQEINKERYDLEQVDNTGRPQSNKSLVMPEGTTDKHGNPVPPPAPKPDETPANKTISGEDFHKFVNTGEVSKETIQDIAQKVRDKQPLDDREKAVFASKTEDINNAIRESLKPEKVEKPVENTPAPAKPAEKPAPAPEVKAKPVEAAPEPVSIPKKLDFGRNSSTLTIKQEQDFYKNNREYAKLYDADEAGTLGDKDRERMQELYRQEKERINSEKVPVNIPGFSTEDEADRHWAENEKDPEAIASRHHQLNFASEHVADYKEHQIHDYLGSSKINAKDFQRFGDNNLLKGDADFKRRWIDTKDSGTPIDTMAQELSNNSGVDITPQDFVDYISKYKGKDDFKEQAKSPIQKTLEEKYKELTGKDLTPIRAEAAYNKGLESHKDAVLDDQARDIIEAEGITPANIDKLREQFKGFPYTEDDFNNVKRYLDHERTSQKEKKTPERAGNHAPVAPGEPVQSVGGTEPVKSGTESKRPAGADKHPAVGLTTEQQRIADDFNKKIDAKHVQLFKKNQEILDKLAELSERNNLFGDDTVAKKVAQQTIMGIPLNVSADVLKAALDPLHADFSKIEREIDDLKKQRDTAIATAHQQTSAFDPPTLTGQDKAVNGAIDGGRDLQKAVNVHPDGDGKVKKSVKDSLSDDKKKRFDELRKKIKNGIRAENSDSGGEAFAGEFNHELYSSGIELTSMYFDAGVTKFADYAGEMISDMGKDVIPYLSSFYEGARRLPGQKGDFDSTDAVDYYMAKLNEPTDPERTFIDRVKDEIGKGNKLSILHLEGMADEAGLKADIRTHLQEYVEQGLMEMARDIVNDPFIAPDKVFDELVKLYDKQPSLNQRSSTKVLLQQYSTPIPYAFAAGEFVKAIDPEYVVDPTAGTGNLSIAFDSDKFVVNEIDPLRLQILKNLGFRNITNDDALDTVEDDHFIPGLMINPPFGPSKSPVKFHDFTFNKLDYIIPLNMLRGMKNDGRAAIIIGGHSSYDKGTLMGGDFQFFNYLHHYYNVTDVINVDGNLFSKQGTTFPTRLILVNGRKEVPQGYAPVESQVNAEPVKTFEDLHTRIQENIKNNGNPAVLQSRVDVQPHIGDTVHVPGAGEIPAKSNERPGTVSGTKSDEADRGGIPGERAGSATDRGQVGHTGDLFRPAGDSQDGDGERQLVDVPESIAKYADGAEAGTIGPERTGEFIPNDRPVRPVGATADQLVNNDKVPYQSASRVTSAGSVIPSNMAYETQQNLKDLEDLYGPIDAFVANELGYHDLEDLSNAFFSEQVDAIGLGIHQLKQGKAIIVGDMTGIGKGRIAAGLIRYAVQQGKTPLFFTENADLFSDIYRDMHGIGSGHLMPFIMNDPSSDRDANVKRNGNVIYKANTIKEKRIFFENKKLPHGTKVILSTYSQLNSEKQTLKRGFVQHMAHDNYLFLDESHNVAGDSNSGKFFQDLLADSKAAAFFSATYAKRADNMPVYAIKTSMNEAKMKSDELVAAIQVGGNALQEIVASQLVKAGQMIRRERDFSGVENHFITLGHDKDGKLDELGEKHRELADQVIEVANDIIDFEKSFVESALEGVEDELGKKGMRAKSTKSKQLSVSNTPFASKMFQIVNQMLFSIKAPALAQEAIRQLREENRKPVISFNSTMESFLKNANLKPGDDVHDVSFSASLLRGLENTLRYRVELPNGNKYVDYLKLDDMEEAARESWNNIVEKIKVASTDMSISPIDTITEILEKEGLSVGEITGRSMKLKYNPNHEGAVVDAVGKRDTAGIIHDFNNGGGGGKADVILLNTSGATGFSMHADKSFKDQRQRVMINGQFELDINKEIQKRGRIDRTNQVKRGMYVYLNTAIPAETRLSMMFADKLKKLQSNTASDQRSKANEVKTTDFLNEYGDHVMTDYLLSHLEIYKKLYQGADPAGIKDKQATDKVAPVEGIARRTTGRAALLKVAEQEKFYNEVSQAYNDFVDYLNSTDQNNLAVKSVNLEAKTLSKGTFIEGSHTQSPFGQDSILEKVEANVLRKPLSKEELEGAIEKNLDGKTPRESSKALVADLTEHYDQVLERTTKYYGDRFAKQDEKDLKKAKGNQEIYKILRKENETNLQQNLTDLKTDIDEDIQKLKGPFERFEAGSEQMVPSSISDTKTTYTKGIFLGFHFKEPDLFRPSNIEMKFAVLDGKRVITVALSRQEFMNALYAGRQQMSRSELEQMGKLRDQWDDIVKQVKARETRYIVTGNILQAYSSAPGQLVSYTTHDGGMQKGILLYRDFEPSKQGKIVSSVSMFEAIQKLKPGNVNELTSSDGVFTISRSSSNIFQIEVPKSTKIGGKYFKNEELLDIVDYNDFYTRGDSMQATVKDFKLMELLQLLDRKFSVRFNTGVDLQSTGTEEQASDSETATKISKKVTKVADNEDNTPIEHDKLPGKSKERIQAENTMPTGPDGENLPIKKLPDIIADLAKGLNVHIFHAFSNRKGAAGSYNPSSGGIKLSQINNLDTAVHEVGHALDDAYQLFDNMPNGDYSAISSELQWFADRGGSNPPGTLSPGKKIEYLKREGIAEFVRAYTVNEGLAKLKAPVFYQYFSNTIPDEAKKVLNTFRTDYLRYINGTTVDRIWANIEEVPKEQRTAYKKFVASIYGSKEGRFRLSFWDNVKTRFTNAMQPFDKGYDYMNMIAGRSTDNLLPDENATMMARLFSGVDSKIGAIFADGLVNGKEEPLIDGRTGQRMNMEWLFNAFDSTSDETLRQDKALSVAYMFAERTIEKSMQFDRTTKISGISAAGDKTDTDEAINFLVKEFGQDMPKDQKIRVLEGARRYQLWADKTMRYMVEKGRMSESTYRDIKEKNLSYVAFLPVQENQPGVETYFDNVQQLTRVSKVGNVKNVIREMTGSTMFKRDPYVSLMQNTAAMVKEADRNAIGQAFFEPMVNTMRSMGEGDVNPFANIVMEVSRAEQAQNKPVFNVYIDGQSRYFMFNEDAKDIYEYIKGMGSLPRLPGFVTAIPKLIRFTAIHFPVFAARHFIRSTMTRLIISRTGSGLGDFIRDRDGEAGLFKLYGGDMSRGGNFYLGNRTDYYKMQNQVTKDLIGSGRATVINPVALAKGAWSGYEKLLKASDMSNRLAEYRSAYQHAITPKSKGGMGYDEHNANMYAAFQARDLVDWAQGGTWIRWVNMVVPFANVQIQGLVRNAKAAYDGGPRARALFALRMALYTLLPTLLLRLLAKTGDYEEEYDNLPTYQRDFYWNFKLPGYDKWVSIPKPYDLGLPAAGMDRAIGGMSGHENAWHGYATSIFQNLAIAKPEMSAGPLASIVEPITNYSFFKQGPIVPRYEEDKLLYLRKNFNQASRIGKGISWGMSPLFKDGDSVDPRYIDNLMTSMFSYYGETAMNLSDIGSVSSRQKFGLKTTGFIRDQQISGDVRVENVYNMAKELGMTESKPIKYLGRLIGEYYNATTPEERADLHDQIIKLADNIYHTWKEEGLTERKLEQKGHPLNFK